MFDFENNGYPAISDGRGAVIMARNSGVSSVNQIFNSVVAGSPTVTRFSAIRINSDQRHNIPGLVRGINLGTIRP